jgi:hypothetical protein
MRAKLRRLALPGLFLLGLLTLSCGPINSLVATSKATASLEAARLAGADVVKPGERYVTTAQYEYQLALLYADKAKELAGFSKYQAAQSFAQTSSSLADKAVEHRKQEKARLEKKAQIRAGKIVIKK